MTYLDRITIHDRIRDDDVTVVHSLSQFTLAQITEFIRIATENNCTTVTAALLDYKKRTFGDFDLMDEFTLDL